MGNLTGYSGTLRSYPSLTNSMMVVNSTPVHVGRRSCFQMQRKRKLEHVLRSNLQGSSITNVIELPTKAHQPSQASTLASLDARDAAYS